MSKEMVGYINLYPRTFGDKLLHWSGSLSKTKEEALKYKDKNKKHFLGEVYIELNGGK